MFAAHCSSSPTSQKPERGKRWLPTTANRRDARNPKPATTARGRLCVTTAAAIDDRQTSTHQPIKPPGERKTFGCRANFSCESSRRLAAGRMTAATQAVIRHPAVARGTNEAVLATARAVAAVARRPTSCRESAASRSDFDDTGPNWRLSIDFKTSCPAAATRDGRRLLAVRRAQRACSCPRRSAA